ncbi:MAG: DUF1295 domain-containing protein [Actinobacteria bacterium]|nr:DUF1295 domain-containing protein [Actinomycetota bacterium]
MRYKIKNRSISLLIVLAIYIIAFFAGLLVFKLSSDLHVLISTFLADIVATIIVWGFGILFLNSSTYDPYWSIVPVIIVPFWIMTNGVSLSVTDILFISVIAIWGVRLTLNWIMRWRGLQQQDWRYTMLKEKSPRLWFLTNLFGINLMPTIIVFIALIPVYFGIGQAGSLKFPTIFGFIICIGAILIQGISDKQMDLFKKESSNKDKYIDRGLWRYSRHPNYLGEVSFWWGIWLMQMGTTPKIWITVSGPILMTLLFVFISVPMMEKHILVSKPSYIRYQKQVSMLKFLPRKRIR